MKKKFAGGGAKNAKFEFSDTPVCMYCEDRGLGKGDF